MALPCLIWRMPRCAKKRRITPVSPNTCSAWWGDPTNTFITWWKRSSAGACRPNWRCCHLLKAPSTRRPSAAPKLQACGSSFPVRGGIFLCSKISFVTSDAILSTLPVRRLTICNAFTTCLAIGIWRWPPTTGARAACSVPSPVTVLPAWAHVTKICACPTKRANTCPSCKPSKTSCAIRPLSTPHCPALPTTRISRKWPSSAIWTSLSPRNWRVSACKISRL